MSRSALAMWPGYHSAMEKNGSGCQRRENKIVKWMGVVRTYDGPADGDVVVRAEPLLQIFCGASWYTAAADGGGVEVVLALRLNGVAELAATRGLPLVALLVDIEKLSLRCFFLESFNHLVYCHCLRCRSQPTQLRVWIMD